MMKSIRCVSVAVICALLAPQANVPSVMRDLTGAREVSHSHEHARAFEPGGERAQAPELSLSARPHVTTALPSRAFNPPRKNAPSPTAYSTAFQLRTAIERALVSLDEREREAAFTTLLPQLITHDPAMAEQLIEACDAGPVCDQLFQRAVAAAAQSNIERAIQWVANVPEDEKRHTAARDLTQHVASTDPGAAIQVADRFDVGRDDGSLEHLMQLWAVENPTEAQRWLEAQPAGPQRDQLYARFNFVRSSTPR